MMLSFWIRPDSPIPRGFREAMIRAEQIEGASGEPCCAIIERCDKSWKLTVTIVKDGSRVEKLIPDGSPGNTDGL